MRTILRDPDNGLEWQAHKTVVVKYRDWEVFIEKMEHVEINKARGLKRDICHALNSVVDERCQCRFGQEGVEPDLHHRSFFPDPFFFRCVRFPGFVEGAFL